MNCVNQKGFSLAELMIVLALVAVLATASTSYLIAALHTYQLNGAVRSLASDIRRTRSLAVTNHGTMGVHWGGDLSPPATRTYRIERNTGTTCSWPADTDTAESNSSVITNWSDLSLTFSGTDILSVEDNGGNSLGGVVFNSRGVSINPCSSVTYPITVTLANEIGASRSFRIASAGTLSFD